MASVTVQFECRRSEIPSTALALSECMDVTYNYADPRIVTFYHRFRSREDIINTIKNMLITYDEHCDIWE